MRLQRKVVYFCKTWSPSNDSLFIELVTYKFVYLSHGLVKIYKVYI